MRFHKIALRLDPTNEIILRIFDFKLSHCSLSSIHLLELGLYNIPSQN